MELFIEVFKYVQKSPSDNEVECNKVYIQRKVQKLFDLKYLSLNFKLNCRKA